MLGTELGRWRDANHRAHLVSTPGPERAASGANQPATAPAAPP